MTSGGGGFLTHTVHAQSKWMLARVLAYVQFIDESRQKINQSNILNTWTYAVKRDQNSNFFSYQSSAEIANYIE